MTGDLKTKQSLVRLFHLRGTKEDRWGGMGLPPVVENGKCRIQKVNQKIWANICMDLQRWESRQVRHEIESHA